MSISSSEWQRWSAHMPSHQGKIFFGSSPNRVGGKDTRGFSAPGVRPVPGGTESAGTTRIPERLPGFRKAPVPDPLRKTESPLQSGQLHHHPTRTDGRITASLCPARDGMRPRGPSRLPPGSLPAADGKSTEFTHSIGRRSFFSIGDAPQASFAGLLRAAHP
jgi:hypothetical protein